jgi:hypothetical protein
MRALGQVIFFLSATPLVELARWLNDALREYYHVPPENIVPWAPGWSVEHLRAFQFGPAEMIRWDARHPVLAFLGHGFYRMSGWARLGLYVYAARRYR